MTINFIKVKIILITFVFVSSNSLSQVLKPASWSFKVEKGEISTSDEVILQFIVKLDDTWQLYSTNQNPEVGPQPAEINFESNES